MDRDIYNHGLGCQLYYNDKFKDFKIKVGNEEILVHRCILGAKSPVFETMLTSDMVEGRSGQMLIVDFTFRTVQEAINYFYKGDISSDYHKNGVILAELVQFANKYDIEELMTYCLWIIEKYKSDFDKDEKRLLICTAVETSSKTIVDKILQIFETKGFATVEPIHSMEMTIDEPPVQRQGRGQGRLTLSPSLESLGSNFPEEPFEYNYAEESNY